MEFIRKNLAFAIFTAICACLLIALVLLDRKAAADLKQAEKKATDQQNFFEEISRGEFALNQTNLKRARANHQLAQRELNDLLRNLDRTYTPKRQTMSGVECVSRVRDFARELRTTLRQRDIALSENAAFFSFDAVAKSSNLPTASQVPRILRQLEVVEDIVSRVADAYVTELADITRLPAGTPREDVDTGGFEAARYSLSVRAQPDRIQALLNDLNRGENHLFLLRNLTFVRENPGALPRPQATEIEQEERPPSARRPSARMRRFDDTLRDDESRRAGPRPEDDDDTAPELEPPTRKERVVFDSAPVTARLVLSLIEFKAPDQPEQTPGT